MCYANVYINERMCRNDTECKMSTLIQVFKNYSFNSDCKKVNFFLICQVFNSIGIGKNMHPTSKLKVFISEVIVLVRNRDPNRPPSHTFLNLQQKTSFFDQKMNTFKYTMNYPSAEDEKWSNTKL